jgi:hypothetical protein
LPVGDFISTQNDDDDDDDDDDDNQFIVAWTSVLCTNITMTQTRIYS